MFRTLNIQSLALWLSVPSQGGLPQVLITKGSLFPGAWVAFARVTILNIQKSNGVSCPGWSSESQWQPAVLPYSVEEWNARRGAYSSVLLQYFVSSSRPWDGPLTWYSDPATHRFAKHNWFRELFSNTQCLVCISDSFWKISFDLS